MVLSTLTYQHKHSSCAKKTKDILTENFLKVKKAEYVLDEPADSIETDNPIGKALNNDVNILPDETDDVLSKENEDTQTDAAVIEHGQYTPEEETQIEAESTKKEIEKKKKMRNYMEPRGHYDRL